ncbi:MAG: DUF1501 domain-containing protein [Verrucomicrobiales bacterium]|nr:DUF1501 domain-containing protein [Verrucomicrobiales bacterium]
MDLPVTSSLQAVFSATPTDAPVIVSVFLRGGADGLHLIPPVEDDAYHQARPAIAVKKSDALRLDGFFGLHPDLAPLLPLYRDGELAVVHQTGTPDSSLSHFEAEDMLHFGGRQGGGWLGRFLHHTRNTEDGPLTAVSIGPAVSDSLRGAPATALRSVEEFAFPEKDPAMRGQLDTLYQRTGGVLGAAAAQTLQALQRIDSLRKAADAPANDAEYGQDDFSRGLRLLARLIRARVGVRAATIELGGWDSHFTQLTLTGTLMPRLASGLAAFHKDLGKDMARVSVVAVSEFGRRVAQNFSIGTDHGKGGVMLVLGGGTKGGKVLADWPKGGLKEHSLDADGNLPVRHHTHHALTAVLRRLRPDADMAKVFPDWQPGSLEI